jgi:hypothetical protein
MESFNEELIEHFLTVDIPNSYENGTNFTCDLFRLIRRSDFNNMHKLGKAYPDELEAWRRYVRIDMCTDWLEMPQVGSVVTNGKGVMNVPPKSLGIVYDCYGIEDSENMGIGIIFSNGEFDGFSIDELKDLGIKHTGRIDNYANLYQFQSVLNLQEDFEKGWFDQTFKGVE